MSQDSYITKECIPLAQFKAEVEEGKYGKFRVIKADTGDVKGKFKLVLSVIMPDLMEKKMFIRATRSGGKIYLDKRSIDFQHKMLTGSPIDELVEWNVKIEAPPVDV